MSQSIRISTCFTPTLRYIPNTNTNTCVLHACTNIGFPREKKARMRACISVSKRSSCPPFLPCATLKDEESGTSSRGKHDENEKRPLGGSPPSKAEMGHEIMKLLLALDDPYEPLKILGNLTRAYKSILYNEKEKKLVKDRDGRILSKSLTELKILKIMNGLDDPNDALQILSVVTRVMKALIYGDPNAEDPLETKADLNYNGEIGCMVKAIFGGISTICDHVVASCDRIVKVVGHVTLKVPEIVLLEGNHVEQGKRMMKETGIAVQITAEDLDDAAVKMAKAMDLDDVKVDAVKAALLNLNVSKPFGE